MCSLARAAALVAVLIMALTAKVPGCSAYQGSQTKEPTGSISGHVTLADKPARGVTVILSLNDNIFSVQKPVGRTTTDEQGRFQLNRIPAGSYLVQTFTPAFVGPSSGTAMRAGKAISLSDGETVEGIDIALTKGGVITGRIADADGHPLVEETVSLLTVDERGQKNTVYGSYSYSSSTTDDRGVYRLFGIPPGRYVVSAGTDTTQSYANDGSPYYALTYHPDVADQSRASIVEVTSGGEATGIDITLGRVAKTYTASGRMISAETGKPVAGMNYGYGSLLSDGNNFGSLSTSGSTSNSRGEFRLEGVMPGGYAAFGASMEQNDLYGDPVLFQVTDSDVTGLEIKLHRGSSLSGIVILEDGSDLIGAPKLSDWRIGVSVRSQSIAAPFLSGISIGADGSFYAKGLRPGQANFYLMYPPPKGISLLRVERDGVEQPGGVEIAAGEQVSGVKVIFAYGTGIIRGQVNVEGGALPAGSRLTVSINKAGGKPVPIRVEADMRGRFSIEGLLPGDYDISVTSFLAPTPGGRQGRPATAKQTVSVTNGMEAQVTLTIDLSEKKQ